MFHNQMSPRVAVIFHGTRFRADPVYYGKLLVGLGQHCIYNGENRRARLHFLTSIRANPLALRPWGALLISIFGAAVYKRIKSTAKAVLNR